MKWAFVLALFAPWNSFANPSEKIIHKITRHCKRVKDLDSEWVDFFTLDKRTKRKVSPTCADDIWILICDVVDLREIKISRDNGDDMPFVRYYSERNRALILRFFQDENSCRNEKSVGIFNQRSQRFKEFRI